MAKTDFDDLRKKLDEFDKRQDVHCAKCGESGKGSYIELELAEGQGDVSGTRLILCEQCLNTSIETGTSLLPEEMRTQSDIHDEVLQSTKDWLEKNTH